MRASSRSAGAAPPARPGRARQRGHPAKGSLAGRLLATRRSVALEGPAAFARAASRGLFSRAYARMITRRMARFVEGEWADASRLPVRERGARCGQICARADGVAEDALALGDLDAAERACGVSTMCHAFYSFAAGAGGPGGRP